MSAVDFPRRLKQCGDLVVDRAGLRTHPAGRHAHVIAFDSGDAGEVKLRSRAQPRRRRCAPEICPTKSRRASEGNSSSAKPPRNEHKARTNVGASISAVGLAPARATPAIVGGNLSTRGGVSPRPRRRYPHGKRAKACRGCEGTGVRRRWPGFGNLLGRACAHFARPGRDLWFQPVCQTFCSAQYPPKQTHLIPESGIYLYIMKKLGCYSDSVKRRN